MKRSTIIATCLLNSKMISKVEEREEIVFKIFHDDYPKGNFLDWNREVHPPTAGQLVKSVGRAMQINVSLFIKDLSEVI